VKGEGLFSRKSIAAWLPSVSGQLDKKLMFRMHFGLLLKLDKTIALIVPPIEKMLVLINKSY